MSNRIKARWERVPICLVVLMVVALITSAALGDVGPIDPPIAGPEPTAGDSLSVDTTSAVPETSSAFTTMLWMLATSLSWVF